jgi:hypothetical protein
MAETTYTYTKSGIIPHILQAEIVADTNITVPIAYVLVNRPDDLRVIFPNALSAGEKTELDSLIALHPQAIPEEEGSTDIPTGGYPAGYVAVSNGASGTIWLDLNAGIVDHATLSGLSNDDHSQYALVNAGRNITGQQTFENDVIVRGNFTVSGTQFITETETVLITDNQLVVNYGETASGVTAGVAGIQVDRGTAPDYYFHYDESTDNFKVGTSGSMQPVATREDTPTANGLAYWNAGQYRFDTSANYTTSTIVTEAEFTIYSGALSAEIDSDIATHTALPNAHHARSHTMTGTSDHTAGNYKTFYSTAAGQVAELALSTSGTVLTAQGTSAAPIFAIPSAVTGVSGIQGGGTLDNSRTLSLAINGLTEDMYPHIQDYVATYDVVTGAHYKITLANTALAISNLSYVYAESDDPSNTTNTTYQDKTTLTASGILAGTYRLLYTCEYQAGASNKNVYVRVFDATTSGVIAENAQQTNNQTNTFTLSGFKRMNIIDSSKVIKWQYAAGTTDCTIRRARLELRRIS